MIRRLFGTLPSPTLVSLVALAVIVASLFASLLVVSLRSSASAQGQSASSNADLSQISFILGGGSLEPAFSPSVTDYQVRPANAFSSTSWIVVYASPSDSAAKVTVNGLKPSDGVNSGHFFLQVSTLAQPVTLAIKVVAADGTTTKTYTFTPVGTAPPDGNNPPTPTPTATATPTPTATHTATPTPTTPSGKSDPPTPTPTATPTLTPTNTPTATHTATPTPTTPLGESDPPTSTPTATATPTPNDTGPRICRVPADDEAVPFYGQSSEPTCDYPKLGPSLELLVCEYEAAVKSGQSHYGHVKIHTSIEYLANSAGIIEFLRRNSITSFDQYERENIRNVIVADVPLSLLGPLSEIRGVHLITVEHLAEPDKSLASVTSEPAGTFPSTNSLQHDEEDSALQSDAQASTKTDAARWHGADAWHDAVITGDGVRVGIIDANFVGFREQQGEGDDLPTTVVARCFLGGTATQTPTGFDRRCEQDTSSSTIRKGDESTVSANGSSTPTPTATPTPMSASNYDCRSSTTEESSTQQVAGALGRKHPKLGTFVQVALEQYARRLAADSQYPGFDVYVEIYTSGDQSGILSFIADNCVEFYDPGPDSIVASVHVTLLVELSKLPGVVSIRVASPGIDGEAVDIAQPEAERGAW